MSKEYVLIAAAGKMLKKIMLICLYKSPFLSFSIPKFNLKSWVHPFHFENIFPLLVSSTTIFFQVKPLLEFFKIWVPPI